LLINLEGVLPLKARAHLGHVLNLLTGTGCLAVSAAFLGPVVPGACRNGFVSV
jgi:predicted RNA methylase